MSLLEIRQSLRLVRHTARSVYGGRWVDLTLDRNEVLAIVGESGSGKSVAMLAGHGPSARERDRVR